MPTGRSPSPEEDAVVTFVVARGVGSALMLFLWDGYLRLECFLRSCPSFRRRWDTGLAVVCSYLALFTYILWCLLPFFYRRRVVVVFLAGYAISGVAVWGVAQWTPEPTNVHAPCGDEVDGRAAEEATIVVYTASFLLFFEWAYPPLVWNRRNCQALWIRILAYATYTTAGTVAPYVLQLQPAIALATGSTVGLATACLAVWCVTQLPAPDDPRSVLLRRLFRVDTDSRPTPVETLENRARSVRQ